LSRRSLARYRLIAASILFLDTGGSREWVVWEIIGVDGLASCEGVWGGESEVEGVDIVKSRCILGLFEDGVDILQVISNAELCSGGAELSG
jgi:hypothetical protein